MNLKQFFGLVCLLPLAHARGRIYFFVKSFFENSWLPFPLQAKFPFNFYSSLNLKKNEIIIHIYLSVLFAKVRDNLRDLRVFSKFRLDVNQIQESCIYNKQSEHGPKRLIECTFKSAL